MFHKWLCYIVRVYATQPNNLGAFNVYMIYYKAKLPRVRLSYRKLCVLQYATCP